MSEDNQPIFRLEPEGRAPVLNYNVPEPTSVLPGVLFLRTDATTTPRVLVIP